MYRISPKVLFLLLSVILLSTNCGIGNADVQGSVFIVTNGADNYKLGLVKITAIPEAEISSFVEKKKSLIAIETSKLKGDMDAIKSQIDSAQTNYNELKKSYDSLNGQKSELEGQRSSLSSQFNSYLLTSCYGDYVTDYMVEECRRQLQIGKQLDSVNKRLDGFEPKVNKARSAMSEAESALNAEKAKLDEVATKIKNYLTAEFLMDGLPEGNAKTVTDAEGKFSMKLPKGKYVLVASAQRRIFNVTEDYHWLVWIDATGSEAKQITLSNQNLLGEDTEDGVFKYKELIPSLDNSKPDASTKNIKV